MTIAVTGSTGQLGRIVVALLKERGAAPVALARSPEKAAELGVEARLADYDRRETLVPALAGIDTLLLISANELGKRSAQHRAVIEAAKAAGVGRIVYTSLLRADDSPLSLAGEHLETEVAIKASGLPFTILRNGWYTENYTGQVGSAVEHGAVLGSAGDGRISGATRRDFAEAAVAVLLDEGHEGKTYELSGDAAFTLSDLAGEIAAQSGRSVEYRDLPVEAYAETLAGFGLPQGFAEMVAGFDVDAKAGALFDEGTVLSKLIGRPTTPLKRAVEEALA